MPVLAARTLPSKTALFFLQEPPISPEPSNLKGDRRRTLDRAALTGFLFVLETGIPWEDLPLETGCGCKMTC